ncbi:MAG: hypothetical protein ACI8T1_005249 [Verrucomicrobiales bacterium]|jgi:hypothetical protein
MNEEDTDPIYVSVQRMVFWGEEREKVFHMLEVNGVPDAQAKGLYKKARKERISAIRSENWKRVAIGIGSLLIGVGLYGLFWIKFEGITRGIFLLSATGVFVGLWKLIDGLTGIALASQKKRSLADGI